MGGTASCQATRDRAAFGVVLMHQTSGASCIKLNVRRNFRQCGRVVRAPDLKSGGPGFKSRSDRYQELFHGRPRFDSSATLVNS